MSDISIFWFLAALVFVVTMLAVLYPLRTLLFSRGATVVTGRQKPTGRKAQNLESRFKRCVDACVDFIFLLAGEANVEAYTRKVGRALEEAADRGVRLKMACGPMLLVREDGSSPILELAEKGKLELHFARKRLDTHHFRVGDWSGHCYWEEPHRLGAKLRDFCDWKGNRFENKALVREFERLIRSDEVTRCEDPENDFVLVKNKTELPLLMAIANKRGQVVEEMEVDEIRGLLSEVKEELASRPAGE